MAKGESQLKEEFQIEIDKQLRDDYIDRNNRDPSYTYQKFQQEIDDRYFDDLKRLELLFKIEIYVIMNIYGYKIFNADTLSKYLEESLKDIVKVASNESDVGSKDIKESEKTLKYIKGKEKHFKTKYAEIQKYMCEMIDTFSKRVIDNDKDLQDLSDLLNVSDNIKLQKTYDYLTELYDTNKTILTETVEKIKDSIKIPKDGEAATVTIDDIDLIKQSQVILNTCSKLVNNGIKLSKHEILDKKYLSLRWFSTKQSKSQEELSLVVSDNAKETISKLKTDLLEVIKQSKTAIRSLETAIESANTGIVAKDVQETTTINDITKENIVEKISAVETSIKQLNDKINNCIFTFNAILFANAKDLDKTIIDSYVDCNFYYSLKDFYEYLKEEEKRIAGESEEKGDETSRGGGLNEAMSAAVSVATLLNKSQSMKKPVNQNSKPLEKPEVPLKQKDIEKSKQLIKLLLQSIKDPTTQIKFPIYPDNSTANSKVEYIKFLYEKRKSANVTGGAEEGDDREGDGEKGDGEGAEEGAEEGAGEGAGKDQKPPGGEETPEGGEETPQEENIEKEINKLIKEEYKKFASLIDNQSNKYNKKCKDELMSLTEKLRNEASSMTGCGLLGTIIGIPYRAWKLKKIPFRWIVSKFKTDPILNVNTKLTIPDIRPDLSDDMNLIYKVFFLNALCSINSVKQEENAEESLKTDVNVIKTCNRRPRQVLALLLYKKLEKPEEKGLDKLMNVFKNNEETKKLDVDFNKDFEEILFKYSEECVKSKREYQLKDPEVEVNGETANNYKVLINNLQGIINNTIEYQNIQNIFKILNELNKLPELKETFAKYNKYTRLKLYFDSLTQDNFPNESDETINTNYKELKEYWKNTLKPFLDVLTYKLSIDTAIEESLKKTSEEIKESERTLKNAKENNPADSKKFLEEINKKEGGGNQSSIRIQDIEVANKSIELLKVLKNYSQGKYKSYIESFNPSENETALTESIDRFNKTIDENIQNMLITIFAINNVFNTKRTDELIKAIQDGYNTINERLEILKKQNEQSLIEEYKNIKDVFKDVIVSLLNALYLNIEGCDQDLNILYGQGDNKTEKITNRTIITNAINDGDMNRILTLLQKQPCYKDYISKYFDSIVPKEGKDILDKNNKLLEKVNNLYVKYKPLKDSTDKEVFKKNIPSIKVIVNDIYKLLDQLIENSKNISNIKVTGEKTQKASEFVEAKSIEATSVSIKPLKDIQNSDKDKLKKYFTELKKLEKWLKKFGYSVEIKENINEESTRLIQLYFKNEYPKQIDPLGSLSVKLNIFGSPRGLIDEEFGSIGRDMVEKLKPNLLLKEEEKKRNHDSFVNVEKKRKRIDREIAELKYAEKKLSSSLGALSTILPADPKSIAKVLKLMRNTFQYNRLPYEIIYDPNNASIDQTTKVGGGNNESTEFLNSFINTYQNGGQSTDTGYTMNYQNDNLEELLKRIEKLEHILEEKEGGGLLDKPQPQPEVKKEETPVANKVVNAAQVKIDAIENIKKTIRGIIETLSNIQSTYKNVYENLIDESKTDLGTLPNIIKKYNDAKDSGEKKSYGEKIFGQLKTFDSGKEWLKKTVEELRDAKGKLNEIYKEILKLLNQETKVSEIIQYIDNIKELFEGSLDITKKATDGTEMFYITKGLLFSIEKLKTNIINNFEKYYNLTKGIAENAERESKKEIERARAQGYRAQPRIVQYDSDRGGGIIFGGELNGKDILTIDKLFTLIQTQLTEKTSIILDKLIEKNKKNADPLYAATVAEPSLFAQLYNKYIDQKNTDGNLIATQTFIEGLRANSLLPGEVLRINSIDKIVFIFVTLFIKIITTSLIETLISKDYIKNITFCLLGYFIIYIVLFGLIIVLVNYDVYRMRIIFNYLNLNSNSSGILTHLISIFGISLLIFFINTKLNPDLMKQPANNLSDQEKISLMYKFEIITMIIWFILLLITAIY